MAIAKREAKRAYHREWAKRNHAKNRDKVLAKNAAWRRKNVEKVNAGAVRWHDSVKDNPEHTEKRRQRRRQNYRDNVGGVRDKIHARNKAAKHHYSMYHVQANAKGRAFELTQEQFNAYFLRCGVHLLRHRTRRFGDAGHR